MKRQCAWSGEEFEGKGYILTLSEGGHEVVSEDAFRGGGRVEHRSDVDETADQNASDPEPDDDGKDTKLEPEKAPATSARKTSPAGGKS